MERKILLNPGPATTTDTVKQAQVVPDICPREREFGDIMKQISQDLVRIVHGEDAGYTAVLFCGSGTLCMDSCISSLVPANKKILVVNNGAYSARAVEICQAYSLQYINLQFPVDGLPDLEKIEQVLQAESNIAVVYTTHQETGSGILNPIRAIGALAHQYEAIFVVDTTSTFAMRPINIQQEHIDFCMASAQKGIQAMTGLSFVVGKLNYLEASRDYPRRSYYTNLYMQYAYFKQNGQMHFTPPVQTVYAVRQALKEYFIEGETAKWERHQRVSKAIHAGLARLGLREAIAKQYQSELVVTVLYPKDTHWEFNVIHDICYKHGFTIYPGKMQQHGTFRLCALGAIDYPDIERFFVVFQRAMEMIGVVLPLE